MYLNLEGALLTAAVLFVDTNIGDKLLIHSLIDFADYSFISQVCLSAMITIVLHYL